MDVSRLMPHRFSLIFPDIDAPTFQSLVGSMRKNGWNSDYPIVLFEGMILDGRNRLRAARQAKVEPTFEKFEGDEEAALKFVVTANLHRRHMTQSERAVVAAELLELESVRTLPRNGQTTNGSQITVNVPEKKAKTTELAAKLGVGRGLIEQACELKRLDRRAFEAIKGAGKTMPKASGDGRERAPRNIGGALKKAKAEAERRAAPEPKVERDDAGHAIHPKAARALSEGRERFKALIRQVHALKRETIELAGLVVGRGLHRQSVETDFENIVRQLRFAAPYSSCPLNDPCPESCKLCRGTQWVTESQYDGMPDRFKERKS